MLKTTIRNLIHSGKYTTLNIISLVLGLSLTIMIVMLLNFEISFDKFHANADKILCVVQHDLKDGSFSSTTSSPLSQTLKRDFADVKYAAGFFTMHGDEVEIKYENLSYSGFSGASVEVDAFSIFDIKLLLGTAENVLDAPEKIILSKETAHKFFGSENPVGKVLELEGFQFTVTGMFADLPENSSLNFDILYSRKLNEVIWPDFPRAWWASQISTFVILNEGVAVADFENQLKQIPDRYYPDFLKGRSTYTTTPFKDLHFDTSLHGGLVDPVAPKYLLILGLIAFLTLLVACINFISLSTAQVKKKNIDAGIRRISGASPVQIIKQYIGYSSLSVFVSILLAIPLCAICLPIFESFVNRPVTSQLFNPGVWVGLIAICIFLSLVSGIIPGLLFAKIQPINTLKNKGYILNKNNGIRGGFAIFQFTLTIALTISLLFVFKQIADMKNADLGFNYENLTAIAVYDINAGYKQKYEKVKIYKTELERRSSEYGFSVGSVTENVPGYYFQNSFTVYPSDAIIDECLVVSTAVDENYIDLYEIDLIEGRFFSENHNTDRASFVINETAMRKFGWETIDGKFIQISHEGKKQPVIGVIHDITETSLKESTNPMIFRFGQHNNFPAYLTYRINAGTKDGTLALMADTWNNMFPETPFRHINVKETYYQNYESEQELAQVLGIFSGFAIFLSILGLFGLISFRSDLRTKEIGIRKVNGAKISEILSMLNRDFAVWVAIAFVIATPIAWYAMHLWLENFAYKTEISWWIFAIAGGIAVFIALLTVSLQSWRAATRNPVEALRYE